MGKRDYRHREKKKPKKDAKKVSVDTIMAPPVTVEVVRKEKRKQEAEKE